MPSLKISVLAALLMVGGCSTVENTAGSIGHVVHVFDPTQTHRGEIVDNDLLKQLTIGTSSRADVASLIGTPTARASFDENTWIYIGQITATRIGRTPGIDMQKVVVMNFDQGGILRGVHVLDKDDAKSVAMTSGATASPGSESNFMQQLLGNVGKFTPAGLPGQSGASTGAGFGSGSGNSLH